MNEKLDNSIHFVMQSKGGVGKSVVSALLSQYLLKNCDDVYLVDIDPSNKTLASYKNLDVHQVDIMKADEEMVDQSKFDSFLQKFLESNSVCLVDTGSGEFLPFNNYLSLMDIPSVMQDFGKKMYIHVPISYGQAEEESKKCLAKLANNYPNNPIVVWENEFFGVGTKDFASTTAYKSIPNIIGVVKISKQNADTFERDFSVMLKNSMTFNDVKNDEKTFQLFSKMRLSKLEQDINAKIDVIFQNEE